MTCETKFELMQKVTIDDIDMTIVGISIRPGYIGYELCCFDKGDLNEIWLNEAVLTEMLKPKEHKKIALQKLKT